MQFKNNTINLGDWVKICDCDCTVFMTGKVIWFTPQQEQGYAEALLQLEEKGLGWDGIERNGPVPTSLVLNLDATYWWFRETDILSHKPGTNAISLAQGGNCQKCNIFNEYQSGPYLCYGCKEK